MRYPLDNFRISNGYQEGHRAIDLASPNPNSPFPESTPIFSPVTGTVISRGDNVNYIGGKFLIVREDSPNRYEYYMGHNSVNHVNVGQRVAEGQHIANVGKTGTSVTGTHVHFQIRQFNAGALMNPIDVYNEYNKGGSMSVTDLGIARILAYHILGRMNALAGADDADLNKHHVGKETNAKIWEFYNSEEGKGWREVRLPKLTTDLATAQTNLANVTADRDNLIVKYDASQARVNELEAQLSQLPPPDTKWETLKALLKELIGR